MRDGDECNHRQQTAYRLTHRAEERSLSSGRRSGDRQWKIRSGYARLPRPTATVSVPIVASATIRYSSPRARIRRPRSAPACSIAVRMSVSISFSRTISPDMACESLMYGSEIKVFAVSRRSCSSDRPRFALSRRRGYQLIRVAVPCHRPPSEHSSRGPPADRLPANLSNPRAV